MENMPSGQTRSPDGPTRQPLASRLSASTGITSAKNLIIGRYTLVDKLFLGKNICKSANFCCWESYNIRRSPEICFLIWLFCLNIRPNIHYILYTIQYDSLNKVVCGGSISLILPTGSGPCNTILQTVGMTYIYLLKNVFSLPLFL